VVVKAARWLYAAMRQAGLAVELLETRHVHTALETMPVKSDRNDARGIAQLMQLGWFRPVHCKSMAAQETRALLTARKLLQTKLHDLELSLRGILRGFGLKVGETTPARFEERIRELVAGHPSLEVIADGLLAARARWSIAIDRFRTPMADATMASVHPSSRAFCQTSHHLHLKGKWTRKISPQPTLAQCSSSRTTTMRAVISYIRVSTSKQGKSVLGSKPRGRLSPGSLLPRAWRYSPISIQSAFAVLRLITSSNFVGCSTGRSAGFAPLRILLT
jgi:hypothetical protein